MTFETGVRIRNPLCRPHNVQAEKRRRMLRGRGDAHPGITFAAGGGTQGPCAPGVLPSTLAFPRHVKRCL